MTRSRIASLVAALAVIAGLVIVLTGGDDGYTVKASFRDSAGLRKDSSVKVGGVVGGTITKLELGPGDVAIATMRLDKGVTVGDGAQANVRPVNLLGEKYVELVPGDFRNHAWGSGRTIALKDTSEPVELDDVLNILRPDTRAALRILINEAGIGMAGRGADFNDLLDQLPSTLDETTKVVGAFAKDTGRLGALIEQGDRVLASVSGKRADLSNLVDQAGQALQETADRRTQLGQSIEQAAPTMLQLRSTLTTLNTTAKQLVPAARDLRASTKPLLQTLTRVPAFVDDAKPLLSTATAVAPDLRRLGVQGAPTVRRLRPTARRLSTFTRQLAPLVATADQGGALDGVLGLMNGWVKTIQNSDGLGHLFRLRLELDQTLSTSLLDSLGLNPVLARRKRSPASAKPKPTDARPLKSGLPAPAVSPSQSDKPKLKLPIPQLPGTSLDDKLRDPQQTTGDVGALLDYLLGG